jgi:predicted nucleic acid-binding protein
MLAAVVDTDVVSFEFKRDTRAQLYAPDVAGRTLVVSFMTVAELDLWAVRHHWGPARKARMEQHLRRYILHPFDRVLCLKWAEVTDVARRNGRPILTADAWIAATALIVGAPLITHNPDDYAGVDGLTVISEAGP